MAFERRLEPEQWEGTGLSRHLSLLAGAAPPRRPARPGAARAGDRVGRLGRPHAGKRPRLRHPGAGAVEDRRRHRAARSDHREPRARDGARGGAAARAHHPPAGPPSKFVPESRRRLQGTLLTCGLYKRSPPAGLTNGSGAPEVVQLTASIGGDPKGVLKTSTNLEAAAEAIRKTLEVSATDRILCSLPLHGSYGFDFGLLTSLATGATLFLEDEVSPKRIAKLLREQKIDLFAGTP